MTKPEYTKRYYETHKEEMKERNRQYAKSHKEERRQRDTKNAEKLRAYKKDWHAKHPVDKEKHRISQRKSYLKREYGNLLKDPLTAYDEMFKQQLGKCAICGTDNGGRFLCIDHNHQTSYVRGLLCNKCNRAIGYFNDHPGRLERAIWYLMHETTSYNCKNREFGIGY